MSILLMVLQPFFLFLTYEQNLHLFEQINRNIEQMDGIINGFRKKKNKIAKNINFLWFLVVKKWGSVVNFTI